MPVNHRFILKLDGYLPFTGSGLLDGVLHKLFFRFQGVMADLRQHFEIPCFFKEEDGIRDLTVTGVQTCALPISIRTLEGLPLEKRLLKGSLERLPLMEEDGITLEVDPLAGQKTGFFHDQAENRAAFAALASVGEGLDLFCYTGAWSLRLARMGVRMKGVDSSDYAIGQARRNAELNGLGAKCDFVKADVFEIVKEEKEARRKYDFIVLDPPAFVKSKEKIAEAFRAYADINAACM